VESLDLLLNEYRKWVTIYGPQVSESSAKKYAADAREFAYKYAHPAHATVAICRKWFEEAAAEAAPSTVNRKLSALKALFLFSQDMKMRLDNPIQGIKMLPIPDRLPKPVEHMDILKLLECCRFHAKTDVWAKQDLLIIEMLYGSGLRREEAATLKLGNIKSSEVLTVIGKGNKERMTIITDSEFDALVWWILAITGRDDLMQTMGAENGFWFLHKEEPLHPIFWTPKGPVMEMSDPGHYLWERITLRAKQCNIRVTPHMLRHSFGTELTNNGAGLFEVAEVMGHKDPRTTKGYTRRSLVGLRKIRSAHTRQFDEVNL
jgi:site-specific recombinase XerD